MYTNSNVVDTLAVWAEQTSSFVDKFLDLTAPFLLDKPRIASKHQFILKHLAISCNYASQSAISLISNGSLWEAEILLRSVSEGSLKYAFLCIGTNSDDIDRKFDEYWDFLFEIALIKEHQKSSHILSLIGDDTSLEWKPLRDKLLPKEELEQLQQKYPRKLRQHLEQKWSFGEIIQTLSKSPYDEFRTLSGLAYNYNLSSHLIHQDSLAIQLIRDRNQRDEKRKGALELAHGARECSDLIVMARLRAIATFKLHNEDPRIVKQTSKEENDLHKMFNQAHKSWLDVEYPSDS